MYETFSGSQTNLPFQIALYLNVWLYPFWLVIAIVSLDAKFHLLTEIYKVLTLSVLSILSVLEAGRLYLGYRGNLAGKIPELASFWLISTLIQLPLELFLLFDGSILPRLEEILANALITVLLVWEILAGTIALKDCAKARAKVFYLSQLYGLREDPAR